MHAAKPPRVVGLDIETAPIQAYIWRLGKQVVTLDQVIQHSSILSFSYMVRGEDKVHFYSTFGQADPYDDKWLLQKLWHILDEASVVVAHNGARFDMPIIRYRMYHHGMPPPSPWKLLDTLLMSRSVGMADSHKLAYLTKRLAEQKSSHGKFPGLALWKEFLKGNKGARDEMQDYNDQDVRSMMALFEAMLPWSRNVSNLVNIQSGIDKGPQCPRCGSHDVQARGYTQTAAARYKRYRCNSCGGWSQNRLMVKEDRKHVLKTI